MHFKSFIFGHVISLIQDRTLKSTVYRITGSIPAGNYIQLPKTSSQSLGLTGRYVYFLFKPIASKYFVIHIDVATQDGLIIRISFSNLFKEFKSTSTWLQFPFICHSSKSSLSGVSGLNSRGNDPNKIRVHNCIQNIHLGNCYLLCCLIHTGSEVFFG